MRGVDAATFTAGHFSECRRRIEEEMARDPILRMLLDAALEGRDRYLASEVERGATPAEASTRPRESSPSEMQQGAEPSAERNPDDDGFPEVDDGDGEECRAGFQESKSGFTSARRESC